jgi:diguanylate cyclase (GGDEF)-like protein
MNTSDLHAPRSKLAPLGRRLILSTLRALHVDRVLAASDRTGSARDHVLSDADQAHSTSDQASAASDQLASDRDQADAYAIHAALRHPTPAQESAFKRSSLERLKATFARQHHRRQRHATARDREQAAGLRDQVADARDKAADERDEHASELARSTVAREDSLVQHLEELRAQAGADRAQATASRARLATERADFAVERRRFDAELRSSHLDDLTGAYRRDVGRTAIAHEIDRARRADGRFVLAFVDVDGLKTINDRDGHGAGDRVLETVVRTILTSLRPYDPVVRYGGDEFLCGLAGANIAAAERRFGEIGEALATGGVRISVGLALLTGTETADELTARADQAMLEVKARRYGRTDSWRGGPLLGRPNLLPG